MKRDRLFSKISLSLCFILLFNCLVFNEYIYAAYDSGQEICSIKVKAYYDYDKAFEILRNMASEGKIDGNIVESFYQSEAWKHDII